MCILIFIIDSSVTSSMQITCYSDCDSDLVDTDLPSDDTTNDLNSCCDTILLTAGYGFTDCLSTCKFCFNHYISLHISALYLCD